MYLNIILYNIYNNIIIYLIIILNICIIEYLIHLINWPHNIIKTQKCQKVFTEFMQLPTDMLKIDIFENYDEVNEIWCDINVPLTQ